TFAGSFGRLSLAVDVSCAFAIWPATATCNANTTTITAREWRRNLPWFSGIADIRTLPSESELARKCSSVLGRMSQGAETSDVVGNCVEGSLDVATVNS